MAKKSMMGEAIDAAKTVGGTALGAGVAVATGVVVGTVAGAIMKGGRQLGEAAPTIAKVAGDAVAKPILPTPKKRAAAKSSRKKAKEKVAAVKGAKTKRTAKSRKKR